MHPKHNISQIHMRTCESSSFEFRGFESHFLLGRKLVVLWPDNELTRKPGWTFTCSFLQDFFGFGAEKRNPT